jgi:hypothetical protein
MASGLFAMSAGIAKIFLLKTVLEGDDYIYDMASYAVALYVKTYHPKEITVPRIAIIGFLTNRWFSI